MSDFISHVKLENFEILRLIGSGGAGSVYLAKQCNLERLVAIKTIRRSCDVTDDLIQRGLNEARILAKLDHPNIVSIYDVGIEKDFFYMIIEYMNGGSLSEKISQSKTINEFEIWQLMSQVCRGLQSALTEGVIHRDVKPANILLSGHRYVKVGDFGISKMIESEANITKQGTILGTPNFISPETARVGTNNFQSDMYSLGVTIYFCLTKQIIFPGDNVLQILFHHVNEPVDAPIIHNKSLSADANLIIAKMLQKDPRDRYHSYGDLLVDIDDIIHKRNLTYASIADAKRIYKKNQVHLFATKTKRQSVTKRIISVISGTKLTYDNIIVAGLWDSVMRDRYISGQRAHFMKSFLEIQNFLEKYQKQKNVVIIDVDYKKELSIKMFTLLREEFPEIKLLFTMAKEIEAIADYQQYFCNYESILSRLVKGVPVIQEINLAFIVKLAKEKSWTFDLEIEGEAITRVNIKHGDIANLEETVNLTDFAKKNTTWRFLASVSGE